MSVFYSFIRVLVKMAVSETIEFVCVLDYAGIFGDGVGWGTDVGSMWKTDSIMEFDSFVVVEDSVEAHCLS